MTNLVLKAYETYVLANGEEVKINPSNLTTFPFYAGEQFGNSIYFTREGEGVSGDVTDALNNLNPDYKILYNVKDRPQIVTEKLVKTVNDGEFGGVKVFTDLGEQYFSVRTSLIDLKNIDETIDALNKIRDTLV